MSIESPVGGEVVTRIARRLLFRFSPILAGAMLLSGCIGQSSTPLALPQKTSTANPKLVFITNGNSDWWTTVEAGMKEGGAKFAADVEMRRNEQGTEGQIRLLEDIAGRPDVKGVAISVVDPNAEGVIDAMKKVKEAGKELITIDSDGGADFRSAYIGTDNRAAGLSAGKVAAQVRPQGGKVIFFVGAAGSANALARREGFLEGAGKAFQQVEVFEDVQVEDRAAENVRTALSKYPDVGMLVGLYSYNAPAIAGEFEKAPERKKAISVVTFDLDQRAIEHIEKGRIDVSICQNPFEIGYRGVKMLKALVSKDQATISEMFPGGAKTMETGVRVIVPKTVPPSPVKEGDVIDIDSMKTWLKGKGLQSS